METIIFYCSTQAWVIPNCHVRSESFLLRLHRPRRQPPPPLTDNFLLDSLQGKAFIWRNQLCAVKMKQQNPGDVKWHQHLTLQLIPLKVLARLPPTNINFLNALLAWTIKTIILTLITFFQLFSWHKSFPFKSNYEDNLINVMGCFASNFFLIFPPREPSKVMRKMLNINWWKDVESFLNS